MKNILKSIVNGRKKPADCQSPLLYGRVFAGIAQRLWYWLYVPAWC